LGVSFISGDALQKRNYNLILGESLGPPVPPPCTDGPVWSTVALPLSRTYIRYNVAASPTSLVVVGANTGTLAAVGYYSLDNGATWIPSNWPGGSANAQFAAWGDNVYIAHQNGSGQLFRSVDDGINWTAVPIALGLVDRLSYANGVWLGTLNTPTGIIRSIDGGATWAAPGGFPAGQTVSNVAGDGSTLVVAGYNGIAGRAYTSIDAGLTWTANAAPWTDLTCPLELVYSPTLNRYIAFGIASSAVWISDDGGFTWSTGPNPLPAPGTNWRAGSWGDGVFLLVNQASSNVAVSADGETWAVAPNSLTLANAAGVANDGSGTWVAQRAAATGTIMVGTC
jgi:hypothetical protein